MQSCPVVSSAELSSAADFQSEATTIDLMSSTEVKRDESSPIPAFCLSAECIKSGSAMESPSQKDSKGDVITSSSMAASTVGLDEGTSIRWEFPLQVSVPSPLPVTSNAIALKPFSSMHPNFDSAVPRVVSTHLSANDSSNDIEMFLSGGSIDQSHSPQLNGSSTSFPPPISSPLSSPKSVSILRNKNSTSRKLSPRRGRQTVAKMPRNTSMASTTSVGKSGNTEGDDDEMNGGIGSSSDPLAHRRQKRLERNRESARLSRRRRKQYLEVLEERVTKFSHDMDKGRREHVAKCLPTLREKRWAILHGQENDAEATIANPTYIASRMHMLLHMGLSRCCQEMMVTTTFRTQQLKSFALPPSNKFIMWLTLQTDAYFRGGRAASERLSAARIGDRLLNNGTDTVTPVESMWPLFCSEVGLSYEQEEKVRIYQRAILQTSETWLNRHTFFATNKTLDSAHDAVQAITLRLGQRERSNLSILTDEQKFNFLSWAGKNQDCVSRICPKFDSQVDKRFELKNSQHIAANFYILNHRLQGVLKKVPPAAPLVTGIMLRKLSRRPSFESLGCDGEKKDDMCRSDSSVSLSSLKRDASEISVEGGGESSKCGDSNDRSVPTISPAEAQASFSFIVEETLGPFRDIIPSTSSFVTSAPSVHLPLPAPTPVSEMIRPISGPASYPLTSGSYGHQQQVIQPQQQCDVYNNSQLQATQPLAGVAQSLMNNAAISAQVQIPGVQQQILSSSSQAQQYGHTNATSFLPPHLNVVPEELWPVEAADDFLMNFVDEDWAIGVGIDMELESTPLDKTLVD